MSFLSSIYNYFTESKTQTNDTLVLDKESEESDKIKANLLSKKELSTLTFQTWNNYSFSVHFPLNKKTERLFINNIKNELCNIYMNFKLFYINNPNYTKSFNQNKICIPVNLYFLDKKVSISFEVCDLFGSTIMFLETFYKQINTELKSLLKCENVKSEEVKNYSILIQPEKEYINIKID